MRKSEETRMTGRAEEARVIFSRVREICSLHDKGRLTTHDALTILEKITAERK